MGGTEIDLFLTHLAVEKNVAASTQDQAFSALLFLFTRVLERRTKIDAVRAKLPERLPVVLSVDEVRCGSWGHPSAAEAARFGCRRGR